MNQNKNNLVAWLTALVDLKIISILAVIAGGYFVWAIWSWYSGMMDNLLVEGKDLPAGWDVALLGLLSVALGSFWKAVGHIQQSAKKNNEDN